MLTGITRILIPIVFTCAAAAQSNVSAINKFAWSENAGWINFRDAGMPAGAMGARFNLAGGYASGYAWGENIGWINLGSGAGPYPNMARTSASISIQHRAS